MTPSAAALSPGPDMIVFYDGLGVEALVDCARRRTNNDLADLVARDRFSA
jgi:hypothetical protein